MLVDDKQRCLVCDFGQSDMRSEANRLSETPHLRKLPLDYFL